MKKLNIGTKLKQVIEVEELIIYPIFRKMTDAVTGEIMAVFKADADTITKVVCGDNLYPSIQTFENNTDTLSVIYWYKETTKREYMKYLQQTKECITKGDKYFPDDFSSYEDYVKYLKEKGFAVEVNE